MFLILIIYCIINISYYKCNSYIPLGNYNFVLGISWKSSQDYLSFGGLSSADRGRQPARTICHAARTICHAARTIALTKETLDRGYTAGKNYLSHSKNYRSQGMKCGILGVEGWQKLIATQQDLSVQRKETPNIKGWRPAGTIREAPRTIGPKDRDAGSCRGRRLVRICHAARTICDAARTISSEERNSIQGRRKLFVSQQKLLVPRTKTRDQG